MVEIEEVPAEKSTKNDSAASAPPDKDADGWERLMGDDLIMKVRMHVA
jgi:hypothetical protein